MRRRQVLILGAAGRDFHNFNVFFRDNPSHEVVAFTAAQIPDIADRIYPPSLAGRSYPQGIPILDEEDLIELIDQHKIDECFFSYSDVSYQHVMRLGALVQSAGATFTLLGPKDTMIKSKKPVIAVCAVRTGCGKSPASRKILNSLQSRGVKTIVIRHPMPYGNLSNQAVQRFATLRDFKTQACTIEEMEEYEPYVINGNVIYAGADYESILKAAENDELGCDLILWDGGNNDWSFYEPDLQFTLVDPHRPGQEFTFYPGEVNYRRADAIVINKMESAPAEGIRMVKDNIQRHLPGVPVIEAALKITVDDAEVIRNKKILVIEDGPTLTHGGMKIGAATIAAERFGAKALVDPRPYLDGKLKETFEDYPDIGTLLPAMGYSPEQLQDLEDTINQTDCEGVIIGTPIDLNRLIHIKHPNTRVYYTFEELEDQKLEHMIDQFLKNKNLI